MPIHKLRQSKGGIPGADRRREEMMGEIKTGGADRMRGRKFACVWRSRHSEGSWRKRAMCVELFPRIKG